MKKTRQLLRLIKCWPWSCGIDWILRSCWWIMITTTNLQGKEWHLTVVQINDFDEKTTMSSMWISSTEERHPSTVSGCSERTHWLVTTVQSTVLHSATERVEVTERHVRQRMASVTASRRPRWQVDQVEAQLDLMPTRAFNLPLAEDLVNRQTGWISRGTEIACVGKQLAAQTVCSTAPMKQHLHPGSRRGQKVNHQHFVREYFVKYCSVVNVDVNLLVFYAYRTWMLLIIYVKKPVYNCV